MPNRSSRDGESRACAGIALAAPRVVLDDETIEEFFAIGDETDLLTVPDQAALDVGDDTVTVVTSAAPHDAEDPWADQAVVAFAAGML